MKYSRIEIFKFIEAMRQRMFPGCEPCVCSWCGQGFIDKKYKRFCSEECFDEFDGLLVPIDAKDHDCAEV